MMGGKSKDQNRLFYDVSLDGLVPADHAVLDLSWLRNKLTFRA